MNFRHLLLLAPLALAPAACADVAGPAAPPLPVPEGGGLAGLHCTVQVQAGTLSCDAGGPGGGVLGNLIVGGQGTYVNVRSGPASYDSVAQLFSIDVTLQNLLGQPVGTEDGVTPTGIRIFFAAPPAVSGGTGDVVLANPDGTALFTSAGQDFFLYPEILAPYERTAPRPWRWSVPPSVRSFSFIVYVAARVPNQPGVLRWTRERGDPVSRDLFAVWGTGPSDIWAAGSRTMMYNNGTRWVVIPGDWDAGVQALWGSATDDVWAVGGALHHYDGRRWSPVASPVNENWSGVWGSARDDVYLLGSAFGWVLRWNGTAFDTVFPPAPGRRFRAAWGSGRDDVHLAGTRYDAAAGRDDGWIWHWDGAAWDSASFAGTGLTGIWGSAPGDVYAVGAAGAIFRYDGTAWSRVGEGLSTHTLNRVWGSGPADVWAVGGGYRAGGPPSTVLHYDGAGWREVSTGAPRVVAGVFAPNPDKVYLVGYGGMIHRRSGGQWQAESAADPERLAAVAPVADDDAFAVSCGGVLRKAGQGWARVYATADCLEDVWITPGAAEVFAVGQTQEGTPQGVIVRWDGAAWTRTLVPDAYHLMGVWGLDSARVYAVGWREDGGAQRPVMLRRDGAAWTAVETGATEGQLYAVWGSSADDLYAVGTTALHWDGAAWRRLHIHDWADSWRGVWGTGPGDVYVVGGRVAHWNGAAWSSFYPRNNFGAQSVWGSGPADVYVVGTQTLHFNGGSWTDVNIETSSDLYDVRGLSAGRVWAVGAGGTVMRGRR